MTEAYSPSRNQVERYLQGRLAAEEQARVEIWLLENPDAVDDLQYEQALRLGIKEIGPELVYRPQERRRQDWSTWLTWISRPSLAAAAAITALALLLVPSMVALRLADQNQHLADAVSILSRPTATVQVLQLELMRGPTDRPDARIPLGDSSGTVLLRIPVVSWQDQVRQFSAVVLIGDQAHRLSDLTVNPVGNVEIALNAATLTPGLVEVVLQGDGAELAHFTLAVEQP